MSACPLRSCLVVCIAALSSQSVLGDKPTADQATSTAPKQARTDQYGEPLPPGAIARIGTTRLRDRSVWDLAFTPDNKFLASAGYGLRLWDVRTGKLVFTFPQDDPKHIFFSTDGKILASAGWSGDILLFDVESRKEIGRCLGKRDSIEALALSPDKRFVAAADWYGTARLWDAASGKELWRFQAPDEGRMYSVAFSPDNMELATGGDDGRIRVWDVATLKKVRQFQRHSGQVSSLAFSPDSKTLVSAGSQVGQPGEINVWDLSTGKKVRKLQEHRYWDRAVLTRDGKAVALRHVHRVEVRTTATGKEVATMPVSANPMAFSHDSKFLATSGVGQAIQIWDLATGKPIHDLGGHQQRITAVTFAGQGKYLACASRERAILWEAKTGKEVHRLHENLEWEPVLSASPDGKFLAVRTYKTSEIVLWNVDTRRVVHRFPDGPLSSPCLAFSPDSRSLVSPGRGGSLDVWDVGTGKKTERLGLEDVHWYAISFAPKGTSVIAAGSKSTNSQNERPWSLVTCARWELATGKESVFSAGEGHLVLSTDGRLLGYVDGHSVIHIWRVATGKEFWQFQVRDTSVHSLAFSPDGRTVATGNEDDSVRLWEVATGRERHKFLGHRYGGFMELAFAPDGRMLASASGDTTTLVWDLPGPARERTFPLSPKDLDSLWADLFQDDSPKAYRAIWALALDPQRSVPFLRKQLRPVPPTDRRLLARLIDELDHKEFAVRDKAARQLAEVADRAASELRHGLARNPSLEARRRIERLLEKAEGPVPSQEYLRQLRALEALEIIGGPDAREIMETLAKGSAQARLTQESQASLERLSTGGAK